MSIYWFWTAVGACGASTGLGTSLTVGAVAARAQLAAVAFLDQFSVAPDDQWRVLPRYVGGQFGHGRSQG
jgi:hypothetical protein